MYICKSNTSFQKGSHSFELTFDLCRIFKVFSSLLSYDEVVNYYDNMVTVLCKRYYLEICMKNITTPYRKDYPKETSDPESFPPRDSC